MGSKLTPKTDLLVTPALSTSKRRSTISELLTASFQLAFTTQKKIVGDEGGFLGLRAWLSKKLRMPFVVPREHPLDLHFFRLVFARLLVLQRANRRNDGDDAEGEAEVPLFVFERAMVRLFKALQDEQPFNAKEYDADSSGGVGWFEFVAVWRQRNITIRMSFFERLYMTMEDPQSSVISKIISMLVLLLIVISSGSFVLSTLPSLREPPPDCPSCPPIPLAAFDTLDTVCVALFTTEYLLRLLSSSMMRVHLVERDKLNEIMCSHDHITSKSPARKMVDFIFSPANLIDLAAILPSYIKWALASSGGNDSLVMLRLIRLTRALRLGRRFEAVLIIARSMVRSTRALSALTINMFLGIIIWGSVMYFAEQGTWDPDARTYKRWESRSWDGESWVDSLGNSPFVSIPGSLWWALVTSTTVGYGDNGNFPTTPVGKAIAAFAIIWSLCVLALPIGVIGSNFEKVWNEFDDEKAMEREMARSEDQLFSNSACLVDPLVKCRILVIEVYHDAQRKYSDQNKIFLGRAEHKMTIDRYRPGCQSLVLPLQSDFTKQKRAAAGHLSVAYEWTPDLTKEQKESGVLVSGKLKIADLSVEGLLELDWRKDGELLNPFAIATVYPLSPVGGAAFNPKQFRTKTIPCTLNPSWDGESAMFDFCWTRKDINDKKEAENESMKDNLCLSFDPEGDAKPPDKFELIANQVKAIPHVIEEIKDVKQQILELHQVLARRGLTEASSPRTPLNRSDTMT